MAVTQAQVRYDPASDGRARLRLVPREAADYDARIGPSGLDESDLALLQVIRDARMGLVEQFRATRGAECRAALWELAFKTCKKLIESDDRRDESRGINLCLALLRADNEWQELEIELAIAGMGMVRKVVAPTSSAQLARHD